VAHKTLDNLVVFQYLENMVYYVVNFIIYLLFKLPYINKLYGILRVKILIYVFNLIMSYIPSQKTNPLTEELQNDYLEILKKNRQKREIKVNDLD
jgi:hypothetical protein